ncbi:hypothetical protein H6G94_06050 [Nostoc punctiforme FACHB-252]|uniref:Transposase n=1 Tax=Nostoc punctiforme FACHB-252 TaxID=1357509 RepID=A0ABR8H4S0_NOSPU|nr:hypothetical protein [Nostoc punctiforme]MBD2610832.1 hypothetical protein [Nostoc punctiforme FACHB-252]
MTAYRNKLETNCPEARLPNFQGKEANLPLRETIPQVVLSRGNQPTHNSGRPLDFSLHDALKVYLGLNSFI